MKTVKELYEEWWKSVGTNITNPIQIEEMKRSFYSGFFVCLAQTATAHTKTDEEIEAYFYTVEKELSLFFLTMKPQ